MAHKPFVAITDSWVEVTGLITAYDSGKQYNVQNLSHCNVAFCISASTPLTTMSYTEAKDYDITVVPKDVIGLWAKCIGATVGALSIEEV